MATQTLTVEADSVVNQDLTTDAIPTFAGLTLTGPTTESVGAAITAFATGGQASATQLAAAINNISVCATAGDSVKLAATGTGQVIIVKNNGAASCDVFPSTGDTINSLGANSAIAVPAGTVMIFFGLSATAWQATGFASLGGTESFTGTKTFENPVTFSNPNVYSSATAITAFAGGGQASAVALTKEFNEVTVCATASDSVKLLTAAAGKFQVVKNNGATTLAIFPFSGDSINAGAADASILLAPGATRMFRCVDATVWEASEQIISVGTGAVALPAYTFDNDSDSGIYWIGANNIGVGVNAAKVLDIGTSGLGVTGVVTATVDKTDYVEFVGIAGVVNFGTGTWTTTRVAQGNYVKRHTPGDETSIIAIDLTPLIRTTASKGVKLKSIDYVYAVAANALDAHSCVLDRIVYANNVAVSITSVPVTATLATATQANPYVTNISINTPAFVITDDTKYVLEITVNNAAASEYDYYGLMLKFDRNDL